ncbi:MAG: hypothetical protein MZW92_04435 [Comamonadaceae bacterium]|nr:hypothetical protein [Comamonadaceae bacterium]
MTLAVGMPANERMDCAGREGHRAGRRRRCSRCSANARCCGWTASAPSASSAHWQARRRWPPAEQCGRAPRAGRRAGADAAGLAGVAGALPLAAVRQRSRSCRAGAAAAEPRGPGARPLADALPAGRALCSLSGPEGGLAPAEEAAARAAGFLPLSVSARACCAPTPRRWRCSPGRDCADEHRPRAHPTAARRAACQPGA